MARKNTPLFPDSYVWWRTDTITVRHNYVLDKMNLWKSKIMLTSSRAAIKYVTQDIPENRGRAKSQLIVLLFRTAQIAGRLKRPWSVFGSIYLLAYNGVDWLFGIDIPWQTTVGCGLKIFHGTALIVHYRAQIGRDCILRQSTTIGASHSGDSAAPILGDRVDVGCHVCIIGGIRIGNDVIIGAGSVVLSDMPDHAVVVGNPARVVRINSQYPKLAEKIA